MALLGKGVLAIWNGISDAAEAEFVRWHIREHIPERVGLPGFLRGRRYVALQGEPKYFNFYETETPQTLESPEYRARLDAPTPWTQAVVKEFRGTSRTICEVVASVGLGEGAWVAAVQIAGVGDAEAFSRAVAPGLVERLAAADGIVGVHLLRGLEARGAAATAETRLRAGPDARCEWILLVEAAEPGYLEALGGAGGAAELRRISPEAALTAGIYRLQFSLTHAELSRAR